MLLPIYFFFHRIGGKHIMVAINLHDLFILEFLHAHTVSDKLL